MDMKLGTKVVLDEICSLKKKNDMMTSLILMTSTFVDVFKVIFD